MKRQRFFLAAVATCAVLASYAVPCVCVAQSYGYSEAQGQEICDPLPPSEFIVLPEGPRLGPSAAYKNTIFRIARSGRVLRIVDGLDASGLLLHDAVFNNVKIQDANFSGSALVNVDFRQAVFVRCDFSSAWLHRVRTDGYTRFIDCKFDDAYLMNIDLADTFGGALISAEELKETRNFKKKIGFSGVSVNHALDYSGLTFSYPDPHCTFACDAARALGFHDAFLESGRFENLDGDKLRQTRNFRQKIYQNLYFRPYLPAPFDGDKLSFRGFDFSNSILVDVLFKRVDLTAASFENAALKNADFTECVGLTLEQMESTWNWKAGRMDLIKLPPELQAQVDAALAKEAAQATEAEASPETAPETQSETAPASETK